MADQDAPGTRWSSRALVRGVLGRRNGREDVLTHPASNARCVRTSGVCGLVNPLSSAQLRRYVTCATCPEAMSVLTVTRLVAWREIRTEPFALEQKIAGPAIHEGPLMQAEL